ncbi:MAG: hypothetical protein M1832_001055 [Thelocarpon impressellum]|nr:MAG: hypothetical protein M1832_001055 [Thelocarpon impressellum]
MVSEETMQFLANFYNMTTYHYKTPRLPKGRDYLLEINPNHVVRERDDTLNVIDARWIDTDTGLFIDITTEKDLYPLRQSTFEHTPVKVPFAYAEIIKEEYGNKAMTQTIFEQ